MPPGLGENALTTFGSMAPTSKAVSETLDGFVRSPRLGSREYLRFGRGFVPAERSAPRPRRSL